MPLVDDNRLKGNYGALHVAAQLSSDCLVRPVAADTDVGIDLYCETVQEGQPFLHFWLQVRAGDQCHVAKDGSYASCSFDVRHLQYWFRQPVPVFVALVPTAWPVRTQPAIYIIPISTLLLFGVTANGQSTTFRSEILWQPGDQEAIRRFLSQTVPEATARLDCRKGIVASTPQLPTQYVQSFPQVPVDRFQEQILNQIRVTAAMSILFLRGSEGNNSGFRQRLARVVEQFDDDGHWETFMARGISYHADKDYSQAVKFYGMASQSISGDPKLGTRLEWQQLMALIKDLVRLAELGQPIDG